MSDAAQQRNSATAQQRNSATAQQAAEFFCHRPASFRRASESSRRTAGFLRHPFKPFRLPSKLLGQTAELLRQAKILQKPLFFAVYLTRPSANGAMSSTSRWPDENNGRADLPVCLFEAAQ